MAIEPRRWIRPNVPQPPLPTGGGGTMTYPKDLLAGGRNFYTSISFQQYSMNAFGANFGGIFGAGGFGSVILPIPRKINDVQTVIWEETSIVAAGLAAAQKVGGAIGGAAGAINNAGALGNIVSGAAGARLNPQLVMLFKQPNFKEWNLQWTLAANSREESDAIRNIINIFKKNMSPGASNGFYTFPALAQVNFHPSQDYLTRLKPAAIMAVQTDFTAAGQPSFFKSGAPTHINFTISLRETELWTQNDYV